MKYRIVTTIDGEYRSEYIADASHFWDELGTASTQDKAESLIARNIERRAFREAIVYETTG